MKFRFYITNPFEGCVQGTNDEMRARELSACEEFFIVDTETGEELCDVDRRRQVEPIGD
ncbi:hypothetical protein ACSI5F_03750 [Ralstonia pseudosolanacearum]|uniref:hypothetical protein n=1 Tax=Ralstonia pseudosolanacearum TaxID=1310165 RepID=UPI003EE12738